MPRDIDSPMGKLDENGSVVNEPEQIKTLYLDHYSERLKHREIKSQYIENYEKKVLLWQLRFD